MKLRWTRIAVGDLVHLRRYIAQDDPEAAGVVAKRILDAVDRLSKHPEIGRSGRVPRTRELVIGGTPYLVVYRLRGNAVHLLRVLHGRQLWPSRLPASVDDPFRTFDEWTSEADRRAYAKL